MGSRKRVQFNYDSETEKVIMNFRNNVVITNAGECKIYGPRLNVLEQDEIVLTAAKECLEEMLALVNEAIKNG